MKLNHCWDVAVLNLSDLQLLYLEEGAKTKVHEGTLQTSPAIKKLCGLNSR